MDRHNWLSVTVVHVLSSSPRFCVLTLPPRAPHQRLRDVWPARHCAGAMAIYRTGLNGMARDGLTLRREAGVAGCALFQTGAQRVSADVPGAHGQAIVHRTGTIPHYTRGAVGAQ